MNAIKVNRTELLKIVKANRDHHQDLFTQAAEGYRARAIEALTKKLDEARTMGRLPSLLFTLPMPLDQTKAYDRAIGMLDMCIDEEIMLEEHDYQQLVQDEWGWSGVVAATNSQYLPPEATLSERL